jgi:hypothetical protein
MSESLPPIAVLLKEAHDTYGVVIRREVERKGLTPLPPNGAFVLGALHLGLSSEDIMHERGRAIDKGRVLSRLVECGYLLDEPDGLHLTASGRECALAITDATSALTTHLNQALGDEGYSHFILGLMTLIDIKEEIEEH